MSYQHKMDGQFAESEANRQIYLKRFELLESALSLLGFAEHVSAWKIAIMLHRVAGENGGILTWKIDRIRKEKSVSCSYKTACGAVNELIRIGIFEVAGLIKEKCRGGKPFRALKIDWPSVARVINPPKKRVNQWVTEYVTECEVEPVIECEVESVVSNSLYSLQKTTPPPPTNGLTPKQKAAAEVLKNHLADAKLVTKLAVEHTAEVETVVADFEANSKLFRGPGAIRYRLQTGSWPTDETVVSAKQQQKASLAAEDRMKRAQADAIEQQKAKKRLQSLEDKFGVRLDAMSTAEQIKYGVKVLPDDFHATLKQLPGVYRQELLEAMDFELS